jgi:uncharacterized protein
MNNFGSEITMLPALVLALLANGTEMESQQENLDQHQGYLSPSAPVATGKAPGMKVRLLAENRGVKSYAIVLAKGDEVMSGLTDFAKQNKVMSASFTAIGAFSRTTGAWFDGQQKGVQAGSD